ncbi:hypothetical protein QBC40DRAFT_175597 [Triangularia verruculosa]|uniref:F-box domain-containing protein n=1 Tax=Triangularia verruculosa TaxID=2587418 RepID=A0AAN6XL53_9PEZI|nr:hypothetical protein QBC40DRAFT_175597 [Triangularia verruculosa]
MGSSVPRNFLDLPVEVQLLVFANLDCARDLRALALSCKKLHSAVDSDGWRHFVERSFPSLSIPVAGGNRHTWKQLAESLTWQSRCWDRRALQFQVLLHSPHGDNVPRHRANMRRNAGYKSLFHSVVDAHFDPATHQELVVWGAGEDVVARYRERQGGGKPSKSSWHRINGKELGFKAAYDDVNSIKIISHHTGRAIVTGRHNGTLSLISAEPDHFGEPISELKFTPSYATDTTDTSEPDNVSSLDVLQHGGKTRIAAATRNSLLIYDLPEDNASELEPSATFDLKTEIFSLNSSRLSRARWMEQGETIALALSGSPDPLRYLSLTPTGITHHTAAKNASIAAQFELKNNGNICPNSLEPVYRNGGSKTSLLLSAWRDGTIRLQDLRTPSPFDAVYQDNVDPWVDAEALMTYGADRFIAGGGDGLTVKIFDFRWDKPYQHTSGLPCLNRTPFPAPSQAFLKNPASSIFGIEKCRQGLACHYHEFSKHIYYRPNAKFYLSRSLINSSASIWSFARGSDISPNFYIGISGGVIEANLEPCPNNYPPDQPTTDPNFGFSDWRGRTADGSGYMSRQVSPALMEIGDGYAYKHNDRPILLPKLKDCGGPPGWKGSQLALSKHHRLDMNYQMDGDFI